MNKHMIQIVRTLALTLAAGALTAGVASAQTVRRASPVVKERPVLVRPGVILDRPIELPPIHLPSEGGLQSWPADVVTVFVGFPTVAGTFRDVGGLSSRAALVTAGAYDR